MLEKGLLLTIRDFIFYPGRSAYTYLFVNRRKYVSPLIFLLVTSLIYSFINKYYHVEEKVVLDLEINSQDDRSVKFTNKSLKWIQDNYGYANLLMGIMIAFFIWFLFRKKELNFFEIFAILCYFMGVGMLFYTIAALTKVFLRLDLYTTITIIMLAYVTISIASLYKPIAKINYFKVLIAYILGFVFFYIIFMIVYFSIHAV
ncbi:MAG: DUF3667 domain-containing protein [Thermaurantimonas sp.]|uniref:DUF3667 domain-containing protein n=1 Tax=Thermaurantimonas sp. TaxID=2681568 RepID=UPI00391AC30B